MRSLLGNLSSLMAASFLVQASNAAITTMIAIVIAERGGTQSDVSLIAACYSVGFVAGCFLAPSQAVRVGLIRAYAAAAAVLTITIVGLELLEGTGLWAFLRFVMGASVAAVLAISDTWINGRTPSDFRGRVIAAYSIVLGLGSLASQLIFLGIDAETDGFVLMFAVLMNIAVVLVALTSSDAPHIERGPVKHFRLITITSATASVAAFTSGFATVSIISIIPFYMTEHGVPSELVAMVLATLYLGRLLFQWPIGSISDRLDRRAVLGVLSAAMAGLMVLALLGGASEGRAISGALGPGMQGFAFLMSLLLGGMLFPIYSVASSLAFDRAEGRSMIDISTTLLVIYSVGSVAGPFTVMAASEVVGASALPLCILVTCALTVFVGVLRITTVETPAEHTPMIGLIPESSLEMVQAAAEVSEKRAEEEDAHDSASLQSPESTLR